MKISIITINLNNANGLELTIQSVINQTYNNIEYIVIDGASNDCSVDIIKKYKDKINTYISEPDKGIYNAMNKGAMLATGDYCLFLNSGDCLFSNKSVETIINTNNINADIVSCQLFLKKGERLIHASGSKQKPNAFNMILNNAILHPATFIKREIMQNNLYNEEMRIAGDWAFFFDRLIIDKCTYQHINIPLSIFNEGGISSSGKGKNEGDKYLKKYIHESIANDFKTRPIPKDYELVLSVSELSRFSFSILYFIYKILWLMEYYIIKPLRTKYKFFKYKK